MKIAKVNFLRANLAMCKLYENNRTKSKWFEHLEKKHKHKTEESKALLGSG